MMNDVAIRAEGLGKRYRLGSGASYHNTLVDLLAASFKSLTARPQRRRSRREEFWALNDVNFEILSRRP